MSARETAAGRSAAGGVAEVAEAMPRDMQAILQDVDEGEYLAVVWRPYAEGVPLRTTDGRDARYSDRVEWSGSLAGQDLGLLLWTIAKRNGWPGGHGVIELVIKARGTAQHRGQGTWCWVLPNFAPEEAPEPEPEEDETFWGRVDGMFSWVQDNGPRIKEHWEQISEAGGPFFREWLDLLKAQKAPEAGGVGSDPFKPSGAPKAAPAEPEPTARPAAARAWSNWDPATAPDPEPDEPVTPASSGTVEDLEEQIEGQAAELEVLSDAVDAVTTAWPSAGATEEPEEPPEE